jgi:hypothetical protein
VQILLIFVPAVYFRYKNDQLTNILTCGEDDVAC